MTAPGVDRLSLGLVAGAVGLHLLALGNPDLPLFDCEERYNAGHAWLLAHGHLADIFRLQYRDFCGGCTVVAALAAPLFAVLPPTFFVWKLLAVGLYGLCGLGGVVALSRIGSPRAARVLGLLWLLPPWNFLRLSLLSWGNHLECGLLGLGMISALLCGRARLAGLLGGLGLWVGFSMGPLLAGLLGALLVVRDGARLRAMAPGLLLAPLAWLGQWLSAGTHPFGTIYVEGESTPSLLRGPAKLASLLAPTQVAGLFGLPRAELGAPVGFAYLLALGAALWLLWRGRERGAGYLGAALLGGWLLAYLVVGFTLEQPPWPQVASPAGLRYAAPLYPALALVFAVAAASLRGWRLAVLLAPPVLSGLLARAASLTAPFPSGFSFVLDAVDVPYFRVQASYALPVEAHQRCVAEDLLSRRVHAYAAGRLSTAAALAAGQGLGALSPTEPRTDWAAGVGGAAIDAADPHTVGSLLDLRRAFDALEAVPEAELRRLAQGEAVWRRIYREKDQSLARGALQPGGKARLDVLTAGSTLALRAAIGEAWGRRWARVAARTAQPGRLVGLPVGDPAVEEGLGVGLGEEWGPVEAPTAWGLADGAAFARGLAWGAAQQWRAEAAVVPLPAADPGADRWWGPAPPMLCPCGATCE